MGINFDSLNARELSPTLGCATSFRGWVVSSCRLRRGGNLAFCCQAARLPGVGIYIMLEAESDKLKNPAYCAPSLIGPVVPQIRGP